MSNEIDARYFPELRCQELIELVTDYLEWTMMPADRMCFEQHLARCDGCANYLAEIQRTMKAGATLAQELITPAAQAQLLAAFRDWTRESHISPDEDR